MGQATASAVRELPSKLPALPALAGVRFLFCLHVVFSHVAVIFEACKTVSGKPENAALEQFAQRGFDWLEGTPLRSNLVRSAVMDVSMFFVLSGFIMTYTYVGRGDRLNVSLRQFWIARWTRIYPVYLLALIAYFPIFLGMFMLDPRFAEADAVTGWGIALATLGLVQAWWPLATTVWNPPAWSLSVEAFFYCIFPLVCLWIYRLPRGATLPLVLLCWLASAVPASLYLWLDPDGVGWAADWNSHAFWLEVIRYNPLVRLPEFVMGIVLGRFFLERHVSDGSWRPGKGGAAYSIGAMAVIVAVMCVSGSIPYVLLHNGLMTPVFFVLLYGLILGGGPLERLLSRPSAVLLGDSCYALYILQYVVIGYGLVPLVIILSQREVSPWLFTVSVVSVAIAVSVVTYRKFEVPIRRWLRRRFAQPMPAPRVAAPGLKIERRAAQGDVALQELMYVDLDR